MTSISKRDWTVLAVILIYSFVPTFGGLFRVVELAGGAIVAPVNPRALAAPLPIVLHILGSFVFCIGGALQLLPSVRTKYPAFHRAMGRIVAPAGCLSAATGLWMTVAFVFPPDLQGALLYVSRIGLSLSMMTLIVWSISAVRAGEMRTHRAAMLRAYAIGQGASTQTMLFILALAVLGREVTGPERDVLMVSAWALNLLVAEAFIRRWPSGGFAPARPAR